MRYSPAPDTRRTQAVMWALIAVGSIIFCLPGVFPSARAALQLIAAALMTAAVYIAVRYLLTVLHYEIVLRHTAVPDGASPAFAGGTPDVRRLPPSSLDFVVRKASGRRAAIIEACLSLDELVYFAPLPREGGREREPYRLYPEMRVFNYTASLRPAVTHIAVFLDGKENALGLLLEVSEEMAGFLTDTAKQNSTPM